MKAVTIRQPWAWAILAGGKNVENRSRNILGDYRGRVIVHAASQLADQTAHETVLRLAPHMPVVGAPITVAADAAGFIGSVEIVDVHHANDCGTKCSPWALPGHHHIELANPITFPKTIPAAGRLGLWSPDDLDVLHARMYEVRR